MSDMKSSHYFSPNGKQTADTTRPDSKGAKRTWGADGRGGDPSASWSVYKIVVIILMPNVCCSQTAHTVCVTP
ncbi:hypothetical protein J4Q44_G00282560 [Coregonus suidteri]|uniref:Uncharacterized protein n=1 Tax=Coregonus suidteri TaxID=861788 RepID=A0AAN8KY08_9TELE